MKQAPAENSATNPPAPLDRSRCAVCGAPNECGMAAGRDTCWCFEAEIDAAALDAVPPEAKNELCLCRACAARSKPPE